MGQKQAEYLRDRYPLTYMFLDDDVFNRLGDDAEVTPDRMEEVLEYFVKRTMDRIPMEVMARYIPAAS